jgi:hypothetical protein
MESPDRLYCRAAEWLRRSFRGGTNLRRFLEMKGEGKALNVVRRFADDVAEYSP